MTRRVKAKGDGRPQGMRREQRRESENKRVCNIRYDHDHLLLSRKLGVPELYRLRPVDQNAAEVVGHRRPAPRASPSAGTRAQRTQREKERRTQAETDRDRQRQTKGDVGIVM